MNTESKKMIRKICVDEDALDITFLYNDQWGKWIGQYPFLRKIRDIPRPADRGGTPSIPNVFIMAARKIKIAAPARILKSRLIMI